MQPIPTQAFILIRERYFKKKGNLIVLPEKSQPLQSYGEVLAIGPDCKFVAVGDRVLFLSENTMVGFNEGQSDECFIVPESCVFGKYPREVDSAAEVLTPDDEAEVKEALNGFEPNELNA